MPKAQPRAKSDVGPEIGPEIIDSAVDALEIAVNGLLHRADLLIEDWEDADMMTKRRMIAELEVWRDVVRKVKQRVDEQES